MANQQIKKHWIRWLCIGSISAIAMITLLGFIVISTNIGTRYALRIAARQAPIHIRLGDVQGTLLTGTKIRQVTLNQNITLNHIKLTWRWKKNIEISAAIKDCNLMKLDPSILSMLPASLHPLIKQTFRLNASTINYTLMSKTLVVKTNYQGQDYKLTMSQDTPNTVIIESGQQNNRLAISMQQKNNKTKIVHAHGTIMLPEKKVFSVNQGQIYFQENRINAEVSGHTSDKKNHLDLLIQNDDQSGNRINLKFTTPNINIVAQGQLSQHSHLIVKMEQAEFETQDVSGDKSQLSILITDNWKQPKVNIHYGVKNLRLGDMSAQNISINYNNDTNIKKTVNPGAFFLTIGDLIIGDTQAIKNIRIQNHANTNYEQFIATGQQGSHHLNAMFKIVVKEKDITISVEQTSINENQLFSAQAPQIIKITDQRIIFESHKTTKHQPKISLDGIWQLDQTISLKVQIHAFQAEHLPLTLLRQYLPQLDRLSGSINAEIQFTKQSSDRMLETDGSFTIDVHDVLLNQIIENVPIDTSLTITTGKITGKISSNIEINGNLETKFGTINLTLSTPDNFETMTAKIDGKNINIGQYEQNVININTLTDLQVASNEIIVNSKIQVNHAEYRLDFYRPITFLPFETIIQRKNIENTNTIRYKFDTEIDLGQHTKVHVIGFHGQVGGKLNLSGTESSTPIANGSVRLNDGTLVIYKQSLPIERMDLTWFNTPITDPKINLRIKAKGLRTIDGRDQIQQFGVSTHGTLNDLRFDYFSSPAPMNSFQIITALLTDSSYSKKSNKESLDKTLAYYSNSQKNNQVMEILEILNAIKSVPFFDNIDISEVNLDTIDDFSPDISGITITKRLDKYFSVRYRITPNNHRFNRVSLDTNLAENMIITNFIQNEGEVGIALNYSRSQ